VYSQVIGEGFHINCCHDSYLWLAVIEGSEDALNHKEGWVDRTSYVNGLTRGTRAAFSDQSQRSVIYDLFKRYLHLLKANRAQDDAGRFVEYFISSVIILMTERTEHMHFFKLSRVDAASKDAPTSCQLRSCVGAHHAH
jgi:hypothetical protein